MRKVIKCGRFPLSLTGGGKDTVSKMSRNIWLNIKVVGAVVVVGVYTYFVVGVYT